MVHADSLIGAQNTSAFMDSSSAGSPIPAWHVLLIVTMIGAKLTFAGTPLLYIAYASTQDRLYMPRGRLILPIITDMLGDWPMLSYTIVGSGITMLFNSTLVVAVSRLTALGGIHIVQRRNAIVVSCILAQVGWWATIATSKTGKWLAMRTMHNLGTLLFMTSAVATMYLVSSACRSVLAMLLEADPPVPPPKDWLRPTWAIVSVHVAEWSVWIAVLGTLSATASAGWITMLHARQGSQENDPLEKPASYDDAAPAAAADKEEGGEDQQNGQEKITDDVKRKCLFEMLARSELVTLASCGFGFCSIAYAYYCIELWVQECTPGAGK